MPVTSVGLSAWFATHKAGVFKPGQPARSDSLVTASRAVDKNCHFLLAKLSQVGVDLSHEYGTC
jgi:hypothetical protein